MSNPEVKITPALAKKANAAAIGDTIRHRGRNYLVVKCEGESHWNAYIDNCWNCAPLWGKKLIHE